MPSLSDRCFFGGDLAYPIPILFPTRCHSMDGFGSSEVEAVRVQNDHDLEVFPSDSSVLLSIRRRTPILQL